MFNEVEQQYNFGFDFVPSQIEVLEALNNPEKWKEVVIVGGRSWGKDLLLGAWLWNYLYFNSNKRVIFITPYFKQIESFIQQIWEGVNQVDTDYDGCKLLPNFLVDEKNYVFNINKSKYEIDFYNGSKIVCRSADNPKGIRGLRGNKVVLNEVEWIPESVINTEILSCLIKGNDSQMVYVSTPNGKGFLYKKYRQGCRDVNDEDYDKTMIKKRTISFRKTYKDNPLSGLNLETEYNNKTSRQIDQEILAKFLSDSDVFKNLDLAMHEVEFDVNIHSTNNWFIDPIKDHKYTCGWDIASSHDWSVVFIMDVQTGQIAYYERFNGIDMQSQVNHVLALCQRYNCAHLRFDASSLGGLVINEMIMTSSENPNQAISPFTFTYDSKIRIIDILKVRIEKNRNWVANIPQLISELRNLQVKRTQMNRITYSAPSGMHDDCVMAFAMCVADLVEFRQMEGLE